MAKPEGGVQEEANLAVPSSKMEEDALNDLLDPQNVELANRIKGKKSYFQITSVKEADISGVNNEDNDSMDELDESRADDTSIISDTSKSTADLERSLRSLSPQPSNSPPLEEKSSKPSVQEKGANNGNGPSRFKLVKVAHVEPVHKGRWTCKDFFHAPVANVNVNESVNTNNVNSIVENKSEKDATNSEASSAASSVHLPGQDVGSESTGTSDNKNKVNDTKKAEKFKKGSMVGSQSSIELKGLMNEVMEHSGELLHDSDGKEGAGAGGEIDNKIEQAMDLVKSHLLYAVREEVLELKEKIKLLTEENNKLKHENNVLRQNQTQTPPVHQHSHATSTQVTHHSPARSEQQQKYTEVANQASQQIVTQPTSLHQSQMGLQQGAMHSSMQIPKPQLQTPYLNPQIPPQQNQVPQITAEQPTYNQYQPVQRQDSAAFQVPPTAINLRQDAAAAQQRQQRQDQLHYQQVVQKQAQQTHKP